MTSKLIPAAQYLRMSTDHQRYSLANQSAAIAEYAKQHGFEITRSYVDAARSGLTIKRRGGLKDLLGDVVSGSSRFSHILVLDVSRWGRYQDPDEAGHYEFICRQAGVRTIYCAENFSDDLGGVIVKHLKRVMAGEYSRELSEKVRAGKRRRAVAGYAQGGTCRYGVARQIVNADGSLGQVLRRGDRKLRPDQSLRYLPEGDEQSAVLRLIFDLFVRSQMSPVRIAEDLAKRGITWLDATAWNKKRVNDALRCELAIGKMAVGQTTANLGEGRVYHPRTKWKFVDVFEPIVPPRLFAAAQARLAELDGSAGKTSGEMLNDLRQIWRRHGEISLRLITQTSSACAATTYFKRFGTLTNAYEQIGYSRADRKRGRRPDGTRLSRAEVVDGVKRLAATHGHVSMKLLEADRSLPSLDHLRAQFGTLPMLYLEARVPHRLVAKEAAWLASMSERRG
ncbi:MAG: recombinase family protein [Phenylobacterium sp.]|uniref:recombinase family protein n=1 Tax=Phenylobacterium sp. TaxID=1871053 RepID=UPI00121256F8|nr:recombinase family protein [Phenylobacterium sp.]TAJ70412.1 MAG: recombinase family protein [Phenylobacterium sp.]